MRPDRITPWILPVGLVAGWQLLASFGLVSTRFLPEIGRAHV